VIYSRWQPDTGGYEYLEVPGGHNINDDLPTPVLTPASKIGVPSIEAGRPVPAGAVVVGEGDEARGIICPVDAGSIVRRTRSLAGFDQITSEPALWVVGGAAALSLLWYFAKKR